MIKNDCFGDKCIPQDIVIHCCECTFCCQNPICWKICDILCGNNDNKGPCFECCDFCVTCMLLAYLICTCQDYPNH